MMRLVTLLVLVGVLSVPAHAKKSDEAVQDTSSGSLFDLRLLENDFREPNGIRVARLSPWQSASVLVEPFQEC